MVATHGCCCFSRCSNEIFVHYGRRGSGISAIKALPTVPCSPAPPATALIDTCTSQVLPGELQQLAGCFADRDTAVQQGLRLEGRRYEVRSLAHRRSLLCSVPTHHPRTTCSLSLSVQQPRSCPTCPLGLSLLQVHRHHPPLVYGRSMADCEPETSTGIAVCRVDSSRLPGGVPAYVAATWEQPHTSARVVPRVAEFARQQLAAAGAAPT